MATERQLSLPSEMLHTSRLYRFDWQCIEAITNGLLLTHSVPVNVRGLRMRECTASGFSELHNNRLTSPRCAKCDTRVCITDNNDVHICRSCKNLHYIGPYPNELSIQIIIEPIHNETLNSLANAKYETLLTICI